MWCDYKQEQDFILESNYYDTSGFAGSAGYRGDIMQLEVKDERENKNYILKDVANQCIILKSQYDLYKEAAELNIRQLRGELDLIKSSNDRILVII